MASFFESGPLPDWKDIKKWLGDDIPWDMVEKWDQTGDGDWLERFVKGMVKHESPAETPDPPASARSLVQIDTIKQAKTLSVSVLIPPNVKMRDLRLFAASDRLRVAGLPGNRGHHVRFPCRVFPRSGKAVVRGGSIDITFDRRPAEGDEVELFIES